MARQRTVKRPAKRQAFTPDLDVVLDDRLGQRKARVDVAEWTDVVYGVRYRCVVAPADAFAAWAAKHTAFEGLDPDHLQSGLTLSTTGDHLLEVCLWFAPQCVTLPLSNESVALVVHETFHGVHQAMYRRNVPMTPDTAEPWAYYLDTVVRVVLGMVQDLSKEA